MLIKILLRVTLFAYLLFSIEICTATAKKTKQKTKESKETAHMRKKQEELAKFVKEDEGHLVEPFLGGYNSQ